MRIAHSQIRFWTSFDELLVNFFETLKKGFWCGLRGWKKLRNWRIWGALLGVDFMILLGVNQCFAPLPCTVYLVEDCNESAFGWLYSAGIDELRWKKINLCFRITFWPVCDDILEGSKMDQFPMWDIARTSLKLFSVVKSPRKCEKRILHKILHRFRGPFFSTQKISMKILILKKKRFWKFRFFKKNLENMFLVIEKIMRNWKFYK